MDSQIPQGENKVGNLQNLQTACNDKARYLTSSRSIYFTKQILTYYDPCNSGQISLPTVISYSLVNPKHFITVFPFFLSCICPDPEWRILTYQICQHQNMYWVWFTGDSGCVYNHVQCGYERYLGCWQQSIGVYISRIEKCIAVKLCMFVKTYFDTSVCYRLS